MNGLFDVSVCKVYIAGVQREILCTKYRWGFTTDNSQKKMVRNSVLQIRLSDLDFPSIP